MSQLTGLNLGARFLLELCILGALAYWAMHLAAPGALRAGLAVGAPLLAAVVWGSFLSPKAAVALALPARLILEAVVFGSAALALAASGRPGLGGAFAAAALLNRVLMGVWGQ